MRLQPFTFDTGALELLLGLGHLGRCPFPLDRSFLKLLLGGAQLFPQFLHFGHGSRLALGSLLSGFLQILLLLGQLLLLLTQLLLLLGDLLLELAQLLLLLLRKLLLLRQSLLQFPSDLFGPLGPFLLRLDGLDGGSFQLAGPLLELSLGVGQITFGLFGSLPIFSHLVLALGQLFFLLLDVLLEPLELLLFGLHHFPRSLLHISQYLVLLPLKPLILLLGPLQPLIRLLKLVLERDQHLLRFFQLGNQLISLSRNLLQLHFHFGQLLLPLGHVSRQLLPLGVEPAQLVLHRVNHLLQLDNFIFGPVAGFERSMKSVKFLAQPLVLRLCRLNFAGQFFALLHQPVQLLLGRLAVLLEFAQMFLQFDIETLDLDVRTLLLLGQPLAFHLQFLCPLGQLLLLLLPGSDDSFFMSFQLDNLGFEFLFVSFFLFQFLRYSDHFGLGPVVFVFDLLDLDAEAIHLHLAAILIVAGLGHQGDAPFHILRHPGQFRLALFAVESQSLDFLLAGFVLVAVTLRFGQGPGQFRLESLDFSLRPAQLRLDAVQFGRVLGNGLMPGSLFHIVRLTFQFDFETGVLLVRPLLVRLELLHLGLDAQQSIFVPFRFDGQLVLLLFGPFLLVLVFTNSSGEPVHFLLLVLAFRPVAVALYLDPAQFRLDSFVLFRYHFQLHLFAGEILLGLLQSHLRFGVLGSVALQLEVDAGQLALQFLLLGVGPAVLALALLLPLAQHLNVDRMFLQLFFQLLFVLFRLGQLKQSPVQALLHVLQLFVRFAEVFAGPGRQQLAFVALAAQPLLLGRGRVQLALQSVHFALGPVRLLQEALHLFGRVVPLFQRFGPVHLGLVQPLAQQAQFRRQIVAFRLEIKEEKMF